MAQKPARIYSVEFKESAVHRMVAGERVRALAEERHVKPGVLYRWWSNYDQYGVTTLRGPGRARPGTEVVRLSPSAPIVRPRSSRGRPRRRPDADEAAKRIAELERKVGEQALELDFFERALRHIKAVRPPSDGRGGSPSSRSSTR